VIDLHCHLLPGVDDGAATVGHSIAMAEAALADGIDAIVATPHVNRRFATDPYSIRPAVEDLRRVFADHGLALTVHPGAEVAVSAVPDLGDDELRACCIADGPYLLLEPSFSNPMPFLGQLVFELGLERLRPLLVHPERSLHLQRKPEELRRLAEQGVGLIVNVGSVTGAFGPAAHKAAWSLLSEGMVHALASDAHEPATRAPELAGPLSGQPIGDDALAFLTATAPAAIVAGEPLPSRPPRIEPPRRRFALFRRS